MEIRQLTVATVFFIKFAFVTGFILSCFGTKIYANGQTET